MDYAQGSTDAVSTAISGKEWAATTSSRGGPTSVLGWLASGSMRPLADHGIRSSAGSGNLRPLDGLGSADDLAKRGIGDVPVPPGDVAADHAGLLAVGGVVDRK